MCVIRTSWIYFGPSVFVIFHTVGGREETDSFKRSSARDFKRLYGGDYREAETEDGSALLGAPFNAVVAVPYVFGPPGSGSGPDPNPDPSII
jgi:hypothetical protein